jgi:uncharacterized protein YndB with AHSA1/START domain
MNADAITRETRIAASQQRVWDVVTRAEHVGRWFGDAGAEIDLRPGGALRLSWAEHGTALGRVEQVSPIDLFSFRWAGPRDTEPAPGNSTLVEFRLIPDGDGTRLIVTESGFSALDDTPEGRARYRAGNEEGWRYEIGELVEYIERVTA